MKKVLIYSLGGFSLLYLTTLSISVFKISQDVDIWLLFLVLVVLGFFSYQPKTNQNIKFSALVTGLAAGAYSITGNSFDGFRPYSIFAAAITLIIGVVLGIIGGFIKSKLKL